eukprot:Sspe_Gene.44193::Locus_21655_Transcript_3_6_Confidence_0.222_Length_9421::g.44193::m.44193
MSACQKRRSSVSVDIDNIPSLACSESPGGSMSKADEGNPPRPSEGFELGSSTPPPDAASPIETKPLVGDACSTGSSPQSPKRPTPSRVVSEMKRVKNDLVQSFFGDMLYNQHRSNPTALTIFAFIAAFVLLWMIVVDIFGITTEKDYQIEFERKPPPSAVFGVPLGEITVIVADQNLVKVSGAVVTVFAYPAGTLPLNITTRAGDPIHMRDVSCTGYYYGDPGYHNNEDGLYCVTQLAGNEVESDSTGRAHFRNLTILGGWPGLYTLIFVTRVPGLAPLTAPFTGGNLDPSDDEAVTVSGGFMEYTVRVTSPLRSLEVTLPAPDALAVGAEFAVEATAGFIFPSDVTVPSAIAAVGRMRCNLTAAALSGRHAEGPLSVMEEVMEYNLANIENGPGSGFDMASAYGGLRDTGTFVNVTLRFPRASVKWSVGGVQYMAVACLGMTRLASPVMEANQHSQPAVLYRPTVVQRAVSHIEMIQSRFPTTVVEGATALDLTQTFQLSSNGIPVEGVSVVAYITAFNDILLPPYMVSDGPALSATTVKRLIHPVSSPSDNNGSAVFPNLLFSEAGAVGNYTVAFKAGGAVSQAWKVAVTSALANWTVQHPLEWRKQPATVGKLWATPPSFTLTTADGLPLAGKRVTVSAVDPERLGVVYEAHESTSAGMASFAMVKFTFATFGLHEYALKFAVDDVEVYRLTVAVQNNGVPTLTCAHVKVLSTPPRIVSLGEAISFDVALVDVNGSRLQQPSRRVYVQVGPRQGSYPPLNLLPTVGAKLGSLREVGFPVGANGEARVTVRVEAGYACLASFFVHCGGPDVFPSGGIPVEVRRNIADFSATGPFASGSSVEARVSLGNRGLTAGIVVAQGPSRSYVYRLGGFPTGEAVSGVDGVATPRVTLDSVNAPGRYFMAVWVAGVWKVLSSPIVITSPVASMQLVNAASSSTLPGGVFTSQPSVRLLDAAGRGVAGAYVSANLAVVRRDGSQDPIDILYEPMMVMEGCLVTLGVPNGLPISNPSGSDGVASFSLLGLAGGAVDKTFVIQYTYLYGSQPVRVSETITRVFSEPTAVTIAVQPSPVATLGSTLSLPIVLSAWRGGVAVPIIASAKAVPFNTSHELKGRLQQESELFQSEANIPLRLTGLSFTDDSETGSYQIAIMVPGALHPALTTEVGLTKDPHILQIDEEAPRRAYVGTPFTVRVRARLGDGTPVTNVIVTSTLEISSRHVLRKSGCLGDSCGSMALSSGSAVTDGDGYAVFHIVVTAGHEGPFQMTFKAQRSSESVFLAARSLATAAQFYGGARVPQGEVSQAPSAFRTYLGQRVKSATGQNVAMMALSSAFGYFSESLSTVTTTMDLDIVNEVGMVNISVQPMLDPPGTTTPASKLGELYGVFDVQPLIRVVDKGGRGLEGKAVSVSVIQRGSDAMVVVDYNRYVRSDAEGYFRFEGLRLNSTPPGTYMLVFICEGQMSNYSTEVYLLPKQTFIDIGSMYFRIFCVAVLILPWLLANVPDNSAFWAASSLLLNVALPVVIYIFIPELVLMDNIFIRLTLALIGFQILFLTFAFAYLLSGQIRNLRINKEDAVLNSYRYVRWLVRYKPFSTKEEMILHREELCRESLSALQGFRLMVYNGYLGLRYGGGCRVSITGGQHQFTWKREGGEFSLHRNPNCYRLTADTFRYKYGIIFGANTGSTAVSLKLRGGIASRLPENFAETMRCELSSLLGVEEECIANMNFSEDTSSIVGGVIADFTLQTSLSTAEVTALLTEKVGTKFGKLNLHAVSHVEGADVRRDNDPEWTVCDSLAIKFHFAMVPIIVEEERKHTTAVKAEEPALLDEEDEESEDGGEPESVSVGRTWVKHTLPEGMTRSNGKPYSSFWTPNYDQESELVLVENSPMDLNRVPLDRLTPERGGCPPDIYYPIEIPFRFLVCSAICFVIILVLIFLSRYVFIEIIDYLDTLQDHLPEPPDVSPAEEQRINRDLQDSIRAGLETIAQSDPKFSFLYSISSSVRNVDFVGWWKTLHSLSDEVVLAIRIAGITGITVGVVAMFTNWILLTRNIPVNMKKVRRGEGHEGDLPFRASLVVADRYVGMQAMHLVLAYFIIFGIVFLVVAVVAMPSARSAIVAHTQLAFSTAILTSFFMVFVELFVKTFWAPGSTVKKPVLYSRYQLVALAFYTVSGVVTTVVRWVKSIAAQTIFFARLDLQLFPKQINFLDQGYWSYYSMIYVDECHNNPILRVFVSILISDTILRRRQWKISALTSARARNRDSPPQSPSSIGTGIRYVRFVPLTVRNSDGYALPKVGGVQLFEDEELRCVGGEPLAYYEVAEAEEVNFRYSRMPLGPMHGVSSKGKGCYLCGELGPAYFSCTSKEFQGLRFLRITPLRFGEGVARSPDGFLTALRVRGADKEFPVDVVVNNSQHFVALLPQRHIVDAVRLDQSTIPKTYELKSWRLEGSVDGVLWGTIHDQNGAEEGWVKVPTSPPWAMCTRCFQRRSPREGQGRHLSLVPTIVTMETSGVVLLELKKERSTPLRAYSVLTDSGPTSTDPTSWRLEAAVEMEGPWVVLHEVVGPSEILPTSRGAWSTTFPCWNVDHTQPRSTSTDITLTRRDVLLPTLRAMVNVRLRHVEGGSSRVVAHQEKRKEVDSEEMRTLQHCPAASFQSPLEHHVYQKAWCMRAKWWMAFVLVLNPSLVRERKNRYIPQGIDASRATTTEIDREATRRASRRRSTRHSVTASSHHAQPQGLYDHPRSIAAIEANTAVLRDSLTLSYWRPCERAGWHVGNLFPTPPSLPSTPSEMIAVLVHGAPCLSGDFQLVEGELCVAHAEEEGVLNIPVGTVRRICWASFGQANSKGAGGQVDVTSQVESFLCDGGVEGLQVGGEKRGERYLETASVAVNGFAIQTSEKVSRRLTVVYEKQVWKRKELRAQAATNGCTMQNCPCQSQMLPCQLHSVGGVWRLDCGIPAPGIKYTFAQSIEGSASKAPTKSDGQWSMWDASSLTWQTVKVEIKKVQ